MKRKKCIDAAIVMQHIQQKKKANNGKAGVLLGEERLFRIKSYYVVVKNFSMVGLK